MFCLYLSLECKKSTAPNELSEFISPQRARLTRPCIALPLPTDKSEDVSLYGSTHVLSRDRADAPCLRAFSPDAFVLCVLIFRVFMMNKNALYASFWSPYEHAGHEDKGNTPN